MYLIGVKGVWTNRNATARPGWQPELSSFLWRFHNSTATGKETRYTVTVRS